MNIRDRLKKSLFEDSPPLMADVLRKYESMVFPDKNDVIYFLGESDNQKRTSRAKNILSRLAFETKLAIPDSIIFSILSAEEKSERAGAGKAYIPQDHFVHLVYLYLLGIYLFLYHKKLHRRLIRYFKQHRSNADLCKLPATNENAFKDFIVAWKVFVLMHDVGYPWEISIPKSTKKEQYPVTKSRNIIDSVEDEIKRTLSLQLFSRIAGIETASSDDSKLELGKAEPDWWVKVNVSDGQGQQVFSFSSSESSLLNIEGDWRNYTQIPVIHGISYLGAINLFTPPNELIGLLVRTNDGAVVAAVISKGENNDLVVLKNQKTNLKEDEILTRYKELKTPTGPEGHGYEWNLYVNDFRGHRLKFYGKIRDKIERHLTPKLVIDVIGYFSETARLETLTITSEKDLRDCEYWYYKTACNWILKHGPAGSGQFSGVKITNETKSDFASNLIEEIGDEVKKILRDDSKIVYDSNSDIKEMIEKAVIPLKDSDHLVGRLVKRCESYARTHMKHTHDCNSLFGDLMKFFKDELKENKPLIELKKIKNRRAFNSKSERLARLNNRLIKSGLTSFDV